nr:hypothetical protein CFP56_32443 [Quercus suber]
MTELERQKRLKRKQDYFKSFDLLTAEDDDETDAGRRASTLCLAKVRALPKSKAAETRSGGSDSLSPLSAETHVARVIRTSRKTLQSPPPTAGAKLPLSLLKNSTFPRGSKAILVEESTSSRTVPQTSGKRKEDVKINLVPKAQQIFHDLRFYFFPP